MPWQHDRGVIDFNSAVISCLSPSTVRTLFVTQDLRSPNYAYSGNCFFLPFPGSEPGGPDYRAFLLAVATVARL
jgi:hypothetical protein